MSAFIPTEYDECIALVDYLDILIQQKKIKYYSHVPSETYTTSWQQKLKNKRMGVKSGIPDYIILGNQKLIFLEMKRIKGSNTSEAQNEWIKELSKYHGVHSAICKGFDEAKIFLDSVIK